MAGVDDDGETLNPQGWVLAFHPDLLRGTSLGRKMKDYSFFSYEANEALHMSERERQIILNCFVEIQEELERAIDKHSKDIIASTIELLLNHCQRFYDRQFITRENINKDILVRFENLLSDYFESDQPQTVGLPSVQYAADRLHLSPNYFGDLIKKETPAVSPPQTPAGQCLPEAALVEAGIARWRSALRTGLWRGVCCRAGGTCHQVRRSLGCDTETHLDIEL